MLKWIKHAIRLISILLVTLSVLVWIGVLLIGSLSFWTSCSVTNQTQQAIYATPIGTVGPAGKRVMLPVHRIWFPNLEYAEQGDIPIAPGETFRFVYDMDDINYSELVVKSGGQIVGQVVVNPTPTANQYTVPTIVDVTVKDFATLLPVPANVQSAIPQNRRTGYTGIVYIVTAGILILYGLGWIFWFVRKQIMQQKEPLKQH